MLYASRFRNVKAPILLTFSTFIVFYYFRNDPATDTLRIPCLFHKLTGWNCWGCGGQRAFHQLLHGNFANAANLNALIFPVLLLGCYVLLVELTQVKPAYHLLRRKGVQISTATLLIGFTLLRNLM